MSVLKSVERLLGMDEVVWARHLNPWSGWTRLPALPLLCLAIWSRVWLGWWALAPVGLALWWIWYNPRAFPPPARRSAWMTRAVLGERRWLARPLHPIATRHRQWAAILTAVSAGGLPFLVWGLWALQLGPLMVGLILTVGGKLWFLDRMVRIEDDMARADRDEQALQR